ncbi:HU family DNA-binding protein [Asticcacaulis sp.]|uniref:HU family DNA-binding protein n=1 Tax=Asticcacaulis sp. TaxID=1872648 RepID=UPI00263175A3|nr:HU family DNA-binding protein [Asticcacaulis sp.]
MTDRISKDDLAAIVAQVTGATKAACKEAVERMFGAIADGLKHGKEVSLAGFGKFTAQQQPERQGRNPRTGEPTTIAAQTKAKFTPAKALKDMLNE